MTDGQQLSAVPEESIPPRDTYKMVVRLLAGGIGEGLERLEKVTALLEEQEMDMPPQPVGPFATHPVVMATVGFIYELPEQIDAASGAISRTLSPVTAVAGKVFGVGASVVEATGVASVVANLTYPTREAIINEFDRLTSVGTAEYARGRVLAVGTFTEGVDGMLDYLTESDEVTELVREQTIGFGGAAVQEIRETGAAADGLAESMFRRIFRREIRRLPFQPDFDFE